MAHRDDHEAARQRIAALERDLEDARAEAERARREADAARARDADEGGRAGRAQPAAAKKKQQQKDKKKRRAKPAGERPAAEVDGRWPPGAHARFGRGAAALAALAFGGAASVQLVTAPATQEIVLWSDGAAVAAMLIGAFVLGRVLRAPEPFGGALVTLLISPMILGVITGACTDDFWPDLPAPGPLRLVLRIVVLLIAVALGVAASRSWITDAASSPIQPD